MIKHNSPQPATIIAKKQETSTITTFRLCFVDDQYHQNFQFSPGQFNMLYLFGVGEVAISISSDPENRLSYDHTIRPVGRVTRALMKLEVGDQMGVRGPFGRGWPINALYNKNIVIVTGGLGCAPAVSMIRYIMDRRKQFGHVAILQGLKHSDDLIYREQYETWKQMPDTEVYIAADVSGPTWPWLTGRVTVMLESLQIVPEQTVALLCGPEAMMKVSAELLLEKGLSASDIYLSMERNMVCGIGHCGHCQFGGSFICKDGPVFSWAEVKSLIGCPGF